MNLYDFSVKTIEGTMQSLSDYRGKVVLVVNTATGCGFTPQYGELEDLYAHFEEEPFEILAFPCNQFKNQAPGTDNEIHNFCSLRYGITYTQFSKVDVIGENASPLFNWLCENAPFTDFAKEKGRLALKLAAWSMDKDYANSNDIKWNFTKFLINKEGQVVARFEPNEDFENIKAKIEEIL